MASVHLPDLAAVAAALLSVLERRCDSSNPVDTEALALLRRAVELLEHRRTLAMEELAVTAELEDIADKLERLKAGLAVEQPWRH